MAIKAFYSIEPGEAIVADEIKRLYPGLHIFLPNKDIGIDLIILGDLSKSARYPLTIQVKESRYYGNSHSWHQVRKSKLEHLEENVDFFVFVTYVDVPEGNKISFRKEFIVIPIQELRKFCRDKTANRDVFHFYFSFNYGAGHEKVLDVRDIRERDKVPNYFPYYNNWDALLSALEDEEDARAGLAALMSSEGTVNWEAFKERLAQDAL